jgi:hypothetical protein
MVFEWMMHFGETPECAQGAPTAFRSKLRIWIDLDSEL